MKYYLFNIKTSNFAVPTITFNPYSAMQYLGETIKQSRGRDLFVPAIPPEIIRNYSPSMRVVDETSANISLERFCEEILDRCTIANTTNN
jgi:hypothetical protein